MKTNKYRYVLTAAAAIAVAALSTHVRFSNMDGGKSLIRALSDGCFVSGVLFTGIGLLIYASNEGFFSVFSYGISSALRVMFRRREDILGKETYVEYRQARMEKKTEFRYLCAVGGCFLLLALLLAVLI